MSARKARAKRTKTKAKLLTSRFRLRTSKAGRPTKLTKELLAVIESGVEAGLSPTAAGAAAGINRQTISKWRGNFQAFSDAIEGARARGMRKRLDDITKGMLGLGQEDWKAHAWLLERICPEDFGRKVPEVHVHASATASAGSGLVLSEGDLQALQERQAKALGKGIENAEAQRRGEKETKK